MNKEIAVLVNTLKAKVTEGINVLESLDVTTEKFSITLNNVVQASNIINGIDQRLAEVAGEMPSQEVENAEVKKEE